MNRRTETPPEEAALFQQSVGKVRPLANVRRPMERSRPPPIPRQRERNEREVLRESLAGDLDEAEIETGEELLYAVPHAHRNLLRRLRRGHFAVQAELDLHGRTASEAKLDVAGFLEGAKGAGHRCVRIVHGKGHGSRDRRPVLKTKLNGWLRQRGDVVAFSSARQVDGGTGAVYVLLKAR